MRTPPLPFHAAEAPRLCDDGTLTCRAGRRARGTAGRTRAALAARAHAVRRRRAPGQGRGVSRRRRAAAARQHRRRPGAPAAVLHRPARSASSCSAISCTAPPAASPRSTPHFAPGDAGTPPSTLVLVRGNHDDAAGDPPPDWGVDVVAEPHPLAPFLACHVPVAPRSGYALCGHVHPGVTAARRRRDQSARLPCFVLGRRRAILPAFGGFTGSGDRSGAAAGRTASWPIAGHPALRLAARLGLQRQHDRPRCRKSATSGSPFVGSQCGGQSGG